MNNASKGSPAWQDCWEGFRHFLHMIEVLFGDLLDGPHFAPRDAALEALRWIRDAECAARALLLSLAMTMQVAIAPKRAIVQRIRAKAIAQSRFALLTRVRRGKDPRVHLIYTAERRRADKERRDEEDYQYRMFGFEPKRRQRLDDVAGFLRVETKTHTTARRTERLCDVAPAHIERRCLVQRFNGLARVLQAPDIPARRLARRLARDRAATVARALARDASHPWEKTPPGDPLIRQAQALIPRGADDG